jgi:hypothetical protein
VGFGGRISERRIPANEQGSRKKPEEARVSSTITGEAASGWEEGSFSFFGSSLFHTSSSCTFAWMERIGRNAYYGRNSPTRREEGWPANSAPLIACGVQPGRSSRHEVADCLDC